MNSDQIDLAILSQCLNNPDAINYFKTNLIEDAVGKINKSFGIYQLYKDMIKCHDEIGSIDPKIFHFWLQDYPEIYEKIGGKEGFEDLATRIDSADKVDPPVLAKLANNSYHKKLMLDQVERLRDVISDDQADFDKLDEVSDKLQQRLSLARPRKEITIRTAYDIAKEADDLWNIVPFIPTQFKGLNEALGYDKDQGGCMRGNIYSIVATSGAGKSTLAKSLSNYWLDQGLKVLFINFEEARDHWERILMTQVTKQNVYKGFKKDSVEISKLTQKFKAKMDEWGDRFMIRHDPDSLYYEDLEIWLRDLYNNEESKRPDIVIIDTIQSLFTKSGGKARWGEFEQIMVSLEKLCKDMNAVFILTVQQNNNALRENRAEFNQSDVGGGVTIPQKSSVVMILTARQTEIDIDSYASDAITPIMEVHMPKNRITGNRTGKNPPLIRYDDDVKLYEDYELSKDELVASNFLDDFGDIDPTKGF